MTSFRSDKIETCSHLKEERIGVGSEFLEQALLQIGEIGGRLDLREDLLLCDEEVLAEREAEHVQVVAAIAERGQHVCEHLAVFDIVRIDEHDTVCVVKCQNKFSYR